MSDAASTQARELRTAAWVNAVLAFGPIVAFFVVLTMMLVWSASGGLLHAASASRTSDASLTPFIAALASCVVALVVAYGVKLLLRPDRTLPASTGQPVSRDRIAIYVVVAGTLGITATAVALLAPTIINRHPGDNKIDATSLSIFTAILPVFSTWVGTVLAAYFSNESYRQATAANQPTLLAADMQPITNGATMVPFERIIRFEMDVTTLNDKSPWDAAVNIPYKKIDDLFKPPGVVRVVIFDDKRHPIYVVSHDFITPVGFDPTNDTLGKLLTGPNKDRARNFAVTASTALLADVKRLFELRKVTDVFVTQNGRADEPAIGWVPDDNIRSNSVA